MKRLASIQSNYIPWKGYFDMIASVDEFIFYDHVQYTKKDWRNRNRIKTPQGLSWLTIPVGADIRRRICDVLLPDEAWGPAHWRVLETNYRRARFFDEISAWLAPLYLQNEHTHLSRSNRAFVEAICSYLGIRTKLEWSYNYQIEGDRTESIANLCAQACATEYVVGPAARGYLDEATFARRGITVTWFDYAGYPPYPQLWGPFEHQVSILDLLFNCGPSSARYMKHVRADQVHIP
jgi:WbqC-like protein family